MEFKDLSLIEIIEKIKSGKTTSQEVFEYFIARIEKYDSKVKSFNFVNKDWLNKNSKWSILEGVPIAMKDIFCEKNIPTTWASQILKDFKPPYNATVVERLLESWMSSIWKVNMDEFAMWSSSENSSFKNTLNPWWENRIPGWSSSWSASCVSAWLAPASFWTDTWWSIRQPASMCGVVWFKPSYWRNSRYGISAMASSLDCPGTITKTVRDAAFLYEITNGEDKKENTSIEWKDRINPKIWSRKDFKWMKVWIPKQFFEEWLDKGVRETIEKAIKDIEELWAEIVDIELPMTKYAIATYYIIMFAEMSTNLARLDWIRYWKKSEKNYSSLEELFINNRSEGLWKETKRRTILGSYVLSAWYYEAYYKKAAKIRTLIIKDFKKAFESCDVIVWPVSPSVSWKVWEKQNDPLKMYLSDSYTIPASLAWLPAMSVPAWFALSSDEQKEKLPVWLQIIAPQFQEQKLFEFAGIYEKINNHWKLCPPGFE